MRDLADEARGWCELVGSDTDTTPDQMHEAMTDAYGVLERETDKLVRIANVRWDRMADEVNAKS